MYVKHESAPKIMHLWRTRCLRLLTHCEYNHISLVTWMIFFPRIHCLIWLNKTSVHTQAKFIEQIRIPAMRLYWTTQSTHYQRKPTMKTGHDTLITSPVQPLIVTTLHFTGASLSLLRDPASSVHHNKQGV